MAPLTMALLTMTLLTRYEMELRAFVETVAAELDALVRVRVTLPLPLPLALPLTRWRRSSTHYP